jgi:hypothetical protein
LASNIPAPPKNIESSKEKLTLIIFLGALMKLIKYTVLSLSLILFSGCATTKAVYDASPTSYKFNGMDSQSAKAMFRDAILDIYNLTANYEPCSGWCEFLRDGTFEGAKQLNGGNSVLLLWSKPWLLTKRYAAITVSVGQGAEAHLLQDLGVPGVSMGRKKFNLFVTNTKICVLNDLEEPPAPKNGAYIVRYRSSQGSCSSAWAPRVVDDSKLKSKYGIGKYNAELFSDDNYSKLERFANIMIAAFPNIKK